MIRNKPLFSGSAGKTKKLATSKFMTTPRTIDITGNAYDIGIWFEAPLRLLCCSLNGLLWLFGDGTSIQCVPISWDKTAGKVIPRVSSAISKGRTIIAGVLDEPIARGIDWIMTRKWMFRVLPEAPYIKENRHTMGYSTAVTNGRLVSYSVNRHKDVNYFTTSAGHETGGGIDPFTGLGYGFETVGATHAGLGIYGLKHIPVVSFYDTGTRVQENSNSALPTIGEYTIVDDFLIRTPDDWVSFVPWYQTPNAVGAFPAYHASYWAAYPLIPLELNWSGDDRYPAFGVGHGIIRRAVQLCAYDGKLYARGLLYMGQAFLMPAAFDERGDVAEYYLLITNSHGVKSPFNPLVSSTLDVNDPWMSLTPAILKDLNNNPEGLLTGYRTKNGDPVSGGICLLPENGEVLLPDGTWQNPRPDDVNKVAFDPVSNTGLALGEKGAAFFCGDAATDSLASLADYTCNTMQSWLAPADMVDSISEDTVASSFDNGAVITNINDYFSRYYLSRRLLPLTWGVFEKTQNAYDPNEVTERVRLSFGKDDRTYVKADNSIGTRSYITATELRCPADVKSSPFDNIPWGSAFKNPFSLRLLRFENGNATASEYRTYWWTLAEAGFTAAGYPQIFLDTNPAPPCVPMVYKNIIDGTVEFAWVNPETAELTPVNYDFGSDCDVAYFPLFNDSGELGARCKDKNSGVESFRVMNLPLPAWLDGGDWRRIDNPVMDSADKVAGLKIIPIPMAYPSLASEHHYNGDINAPSARGCAPYGCSGLIKIRENSSNAQILWKHYAFGYREEAGAGDTYISRGLVFLTDNGQDAEAAMRLRRIRDWSEHGAGHYGKSPVTDCLGRQKYLQTFSIWGTASHRAIPVKSGLPLGNWGQNHLFFIRADLNNSVFDFDAEMLRSMR